MIIERADKVVMVPERAGRLSWTAEQGQEWARKEILCGGPPDMPTDPSTGATIKWNTLREWAGRKVRIRAKPMGLIISAADGSRQFFPGDATTGSGGRGFVMGTTTGEMREQATAEALIRTFCQAEIRRYNKRVTEQLRAEEHRHATREFWESGNRIRTFIKKNRGVIQDRVWFSLEQWGRGEGGYGKNWLEYATYFYDWKPNALPTDAIYNLSETRIMNILRATKARDDRERLVVACLEGILADLNDEQFKWATGQSAKTFPLGTEEFEEFKSYGRKIMQGIALSSDGIAAFRRLTVRLLRTKREDKWGEGEGGDSSGS